MNGTTCPSASLQLSVDAESLYEASHKEISGVEERWGADDSCSHCVAMHESLVSKNTRVKADVKQTIWLRFMLSLADQLKMR